MPQCERMSQGDRMNQSEEEELTFLGNRLWDVKFCPNNKKSATVPRNHFHCGSLLLQGESRVASTPPTSPQPKDLLRGFFTTSLHKQLYGKLQKLSEQHLASNLQTPNNEANQQDNNTVEDTSSSQHVQNDDDSVSSCSTESADEEELRSFKKTTTTFRKRKSLGDQLQQHPFPTDIEGVVQQSYKLRKFSVH